MTKPTRIQIKTNNGKIDVQFWYTRAPYFRTWQIQADVDKLMVACQKRGYRRAHFTPTLIQFVRDDFDVRFNAGPKVFKPIGTQHVQKISANTVP